MCARLLAVFALMVLAATATPASAQNCSAATTQGTAPPAWQTYCWINMASYSDVTAQTTAGQNFSITLSDGSVLTFNVQVSGGTGTRFNAIAAPSWTGAAVGNTAFLGIPGQPILYTASSGVKTITVRNIAVTPPPGVPAVTAYSFVVADAESTDNAEALQMVTNGSNWILLDDVPPISGSQYPVLSGIGSTTVNMAGGGLTGRVGGYIIGTNSPTTVTTTLTAGGLQGVMFAVRFASIQLNKQITGARIDPNDQFQFRITATGSGTVMASGTTTGTGNGPFNAAVLSLASGLPLTISETMATGSVSTLAQYRSSLTCTNANPSSTPMPTNVVTTSYNFGNLQFGDAVQCVFTNGAFPHIRVQKALGATGRVYPGDQFVVRSRNGGTVLGTSTTTGSGTTVTGGNTGLVQGVAGTNYIIEELASGTTNLSLYTPSLACTNAASGSSTVLPTTVGGTLTPQIGDVITCIITNTARSTAILQMTKTSTLISDPVNGGGNPFHIPGAVIEYAITVTNIGNAPVDASSIVITDPLPAGVTYDGATAVTLTNGTTTSGLNPFNPATMVTFSNQIGGGAPYGYTPTAGYDANVRGLRIAPTGTMLGAASATAQPSFTIRFRARVTP
jgi:uncharacterized repeat protein (TIGR01451 family)